MQSRTVFHPASIAILAIAMRPAAAQEAEDNTRSQGSVQEVVVAARKREIVYQEPIDSVFGLNKPVLETPRSVSSLGAIELENFNVQNLDDLVVAIPGTFNTSYFGVTGAVEIRGVRSDTYFRGMKRVINVVSQPTSLDGIGRIDVVRGPASPINGPSKIAGYVNVEPFVADPKKAGASNFVRGEYGSFDRFEGQARYDLSVGDRGAVSLFGALEDADSYYQNSRGSRQELLQATYVGDIGDDWRVDAGTRYEYWDGSEQIGWNRVTQDLLDNRVYRAGQPLVNLDTNIDGRIDRSEAARLEVAFSPFGSGLLFATDPTLYQLDPSTVAEVTIPRNACVCAPDVRADAQSVLGYLDFAANAANGSTIRNRTFFDRIESDNSNPMTGYALDYDAYTIENRIELELQEFKVGELLEAQFFVSPSIKYYKATGRQDFAKSTNTRFDMSAGPTPNTSIDNVFTDPEATWSGEDVDTKYWLYGVGAIADVTFARFANFVGGARYDYYDIESANAPGVGGAGAQASEGKFSFSASLSFAVPFGFRPYATFAKQTQLLDGPVGQIPVANVADEFLNQSELLEVGLKWAGFDDRAYAAVNYYEQERTSLTPVTYENLAIRGTGWEAEVRAEPLNGLSLAMSGTWAQVEFNPQDERFIFASPETLGVPFDQVYAGHVGTNLPADNSRFAERGGTPGRVLSANLTYVVPNTGLGFTATVADVAEVPSGVTRNFTIPGYTVVNLGAFYERDAWTVLINVDNVTDKFYFQPLFPEIWGDLLVIPSLPRTYRVQLTKAL